ncbi:MAG TPA: hypothetical protein VMV72_16745 [Verrucomicrobiae bacterium]|nr:hypothetical protein [Verrucomicrobiae bacterium]
MTQAQFAKWLGVSIKQVKYLEHQRRNPSGPTRRLLDILAGQFHFNGTDAVMVLGADAVHLRPPPVHRERPSGSPGSTHRGDEPAAVTKATEASPAPNVETKESAAAVSVIPPETPANDAFVWQ